MSAHLLHGVLPTFLIYVVPHVSVFPFMASIYLVLCTSIYTAEVPDFAQFHQVFPYAGHCLVWCDVLQYLQFLMFTLRDSKFCLCVLVIVWSPFSFSYHVKIFALIQTSYHRPLWMLQIYPLSPSQYSLTIIFYYFCCYSVIVYEFFELFLKAFKLLCIYIFWLWPSASLLILLLHVALICSSEVLLLIHYVVARFLIKHIEQSPKSLTYLFILTFNYHINWDSFLSSQFVIMGSLPVSFYTIVLGRYLTQFKSLWLCILSFYVELKTGCLKESSVLYLMDSGAQICLAFMLCLQLSPSVTSTTALVVSTATCTIASWFLCQTLLALFLILSNTCLCISRLLLLTSCNVTCPLWR